MLAKPAVRQRCNEEWSNIIEYIKGAVQSSSFHLTESKSSRYMFSVVARTKVILHVVFYGMMKLATVALGDSVKKSRSGRCNIRHGAVTVCDSNILAYHSFHHTTQIDLRPQNAARSHRPIAATIHSCHDILSLTRRNLQVSIDRVLEEHNSTLSRILYKRQTWN